MQVGIVPTLQLRMKERVSGILASSVRPNVPQPTLRAIACVEVLQVLQFVIADLGGGLDKVVLGASGPEGAAGDVDGAVVSVMLLFATAVIGFELRSGELSGSLIFRSWNRGKGGPSVLYSRMATDR